MVNENRTKTDRAPRHTGPFGKLNYLCMAICLTMIIVGFALMGGGGSSIEGGFNPDIFSTRRIVVGPTIAFLGFLCMAFAIIIKPRYTNRIPAGAEKSESEV